MADYKPNEMMTVAAARALKNDDVCFVGIGQPSAACNLARLTHAPNITLIYESGTLATKPNILPLSIGDGELCETALTTVSVPEMFRYWLQGGRIKVGFLGGAQIDKYANLNTTVVGPYEKPKVRLPGGGGAPEIATSCGEIFIIMAQGKRSFVNKLDFVTSIGHVSGGASRDKLGVKTKGPTKLITDLCMFEPGFCRLLLVWPGLVSCDGPGAGVFSVLWAKMAPPAVRAMAVASERIWRFMSSSSPVSFSLKAKIGRAHV